MQEGKRPQPRLGMREWCMLESVSPGKPVPCHRCLCLHCPAFLKTAKVSGHAPYTLRIIIGWIECPPAVYNIHRLLRSLAAINTVPVGTLYCRSANNSCRRQFWQQQQTSSAWYGILSKCVHGHIPYHAIDSREHDPRPPGHQSRISMHDGPKAKLATLISNGMQAQNKLEGPNPYHDWSRGKGCMLNEMQPRHGG